MGGDARGAERLSQREGWLTGLLLAFCLASLASLEPARQVDQLLAMLLLPLDGVTAVLMPASAPEPDATREAGEACAADAQAAWAAWVASLTERPLDAETALLPVRVEPAAQAAGELLLRVGDAPLSVGSPVTHRGVLLGFVVHRSRHDERVVVDGLARVALLGSAEARPVAACWSPDPQAEPARFLLDGSEKGTRIHHLSRALDASGHPLVVTRDVAALGDSLPAGLLLGRLGAAPREDPGGSLGAGSGGRFEPLLDLDRVAWVCVEVPADWQPVARVTSARVVRSACAERNLLIDRGLIDGVGPGDLVLQGRRLVGRVTRCGPLTAEVAREPRPGPLLVACDQDLLAALDPRDARWPEARAAAVGSAVFDGDSVLGGLVVGEVSRADMSSFELRPAPFDVGRVVDVLLR